MNTQIISVPGYDFSIPTRTAKLLWLSNDDPDENPVGISWQIDIDDNNQVNATEVSGEPSTIYTGLQVNKPAKPSKVEGPPYFPSYYILSAEQRWIYLNWLCDITKSVQIGYVFVYYYGLERHLIMGDFDMAFDEILLLRSHHDNHSFLSYSEDALLCSSLDRNRMDKIMLLSNIDEGKWDFNTGFFLKYLTKKDLSAEMIINFFHQPIFSRWPHKINRRYLDRYPEKYLEALRTLLIERYGNNTFPIASRYNLEDITTAGTMGYANFSFPDNIRRSIIPDFMNYPPFMLDLFEIAYHTHDLVKNALRKEGHNRN